MLPTAFPPLPSPPGRLLPVFFPFRRPDLGSRFACRAVPDCPCTPACRLDPHRFSHGRKSGGKLRSLQPGGAVGGAASSQDARAQAEQPHAPSGQPLPSTHASSLHFRGIATRIKYWEPPRCSQQSTGCPPLCPANCPANYHLHTPVRTAPGRPSIRRREGAAPAADEGQAVRRRRGVDCSAPGRPSSPSSRRPSCTPPRATSAPRRTPQRCHPSPPTLRRRPRPCSPPPRLRSHGPLLPQVAADGAARQQSRGVPDAPTA